MMPRKPCIELAGKYHIINRGVAQMHIFKEPAEAEAYKKGYTQHMIAKVLGFNQATVQRTTV